MLRIESNRILSNIILLLLLLLLHTSPPFLCCCCVDTLLVFTYLPSVFLFSVIIALVTIQYINKVAHANTLRGLVKTIDNIGDEEIQNVQIPTGIPIIYKFKKDTDTGQLISIDDDDGGNSNLVSQVHMKGKFLEKPGLLKEALKLEEGWKVCCNTILLVLFDHHRSHVFHTFRSKLPSL